MVECTALEMRRAGNGTEGSNPSLSAIISQNTDIFQDLGLVGRRPAHISTHVLIAVEIEPLGTRFGRSVRPLAVKFRNPPSFDLGEGQSNAKGAPFGIRQEDV